jgi:hypothetical protein
MDNNIVMKSGFRFGKYKVTLFLFAICCSTVLMLFNGVVSLEKLITKIYAKMARKSYA